MKQFLLALFIVVPLSANAVLIDTSIGTYEVTYVFSFGFGLGEDRDKNQPWHGDQQLAVEFATLVGDSLGFLNSLPSLEQGCPAFGAACGDYGPYFARNQIFTHQVVTVSQYQDGRVLTFLEYGLDRANWAIATKVTSIPEPGTLSLFGAGLLALGFLRRRRAA